MKEDKHSIRITFDHDNGMSLDLKGCGTLYLEPHKDYFFEDAPIKFIDYLTQLKRLGITYRLTSNKKGCYRTVNLSHYMDNTVGNIMSSFRHNYQPTNEVPEEVVRDVKGPVTQALEESSDELITPVQKVDEVTLPNIPVSTDENTEPLPGQMSIDDIITPEATNESTNTNEGTPIEESKPEEVDIETAGKPKLIEYAHSLGLSDINELWTKKQIREAIHNKLDENKE